MRVAIFGQTINQESKAYIQLLFDELKTLNASLCIYADFESEQFEKGDSISGITTYYAFDEEAALGAALFANKAFNSAIL